jgi:DNA-binding response OmpR family regulator
VTLKSKNISVKKKILIVEDDDGILDAITIILRNEGFEVTTTFTGDDTDRKVYDFYPDLILLNVFKKGSDGEPKG